MNPQFKQMFAALSASLIFVCIGFHHAWQPSSIQIDTDGDFTLHFDFLLVGGMFGAILALLLVDIWGRKRTLLLMAIPLLIPSILNICTKSYWWFYITRFITGICVGTAFVATPMYIGEIAESRIRGSLCILMPVMMQIGILIAWALSPWVKDVVLGIVGGIIPIVFAMALFWVPESPYYYAINNIPEKTKKSFAWLRGTPNVAQEVYQLHNSMALNRGGPMNFRNVFTVISNRKASFIIIGLFLYQRLVFFPVLWFQGIMLSSNLSLGPYMKYIYIATQTITLLAIIPTYFLVDIVGRRPLLLVSALFCTIFLSVEAVYFQLYISGVDVTNIWYLTVLTLIGHSISISIGLGTLPIVMSAEIFSSQVKASALASSTVIQFVLLLGLQEILHLIIYSNYHGPALIWFFAVSSILGGILMHLFIPETKGRSLTEGSPNLTSPNSNDPGAMLFALQNSLHTQL